jgi:hypothetical protein
MEKTRRFGIFSGREVSEFKVVKLEVTREKQLGVLSDCGRRLIKLWGNRGELKELE